MTAPKMKSDESHRATCALKTKSDGSNRATRATLGKSFSAFFLSSFLSLMKEKRAKENQAPTGGGEVGRVQDRAGVVFSEVGWVQDRAGVVFSDEGWVWVGAGVVFSGGGGWLEMASKKKPSTGYWLWAA